MSNDYDYSASSRTQTAEYDEGLRAYMLKVYNYMAAGIGLSGIVAYMTSQSPALLSFIFGGPQAWFFMLAPLGMIFFFGRVMRNSSVGATQAFFWIFATLMGLSLATIFLAYSIPSITRIFLITTIMFASLSVWGYTTKANLRPMGTFLFMGLIGIILAMVVNFFIGSSAVEFAISVLGVLIFAGLTAFNTQAIKEEYYMVAGMGDVAQKAAISGALSLYLSFLNLFLFLLQLFGGSE